MSTKDPSQICEFELIISESSVISNLKWYSNKDLYVTFKNNGCVYKYKNVPVDELSELIKSKSHGKYFCQNIKPKYEYEKVE